MAVDNVLATAREVARAAAESIAERPEFVGEHLGVIDEGNKLATHRFCSLAPGYVGWEWTVTLARVARARTATVSEVGLVAGGEAVVAPPWVPWAERLQVGDMRPTDVLPRIDHDARLDFGYEASGPDADQLEIFEMGLGRERVLNRQGRTEAATRWYRGGHGPMSASAIASEQPCSTCGFLLTLAGALRTEFGVCANEWSPDDGRVVSMDHGCGAHSQTDVEPPPPAVPGSVVYDDLDIEIIETTAEKIGEALQALELDTARETSPPAAESASEDSAPSDAS